METLLEVLWDVAFLSSRATSTVIERYRVLSWGTQPKSVLAIEIDVASAIVKVAF